MEKLYRVPRWVLEEAKAGIEEDIEYREYEIGHSPIGPPGAIEDLRDGVESRRKTLAEVEKMLEVE